MSRTAPGWTFSFSAREILDAIARALVAHGRSEMVHAYCEDLRRWERVLLREPSERVYALTLEDIRYFGLLP